MKEGKADKKAVGREMIARERGRKREKEGKKEGRGRGRKREKERGTNQLTTN